MSDKDKIAQLRKGDQLHIPLRNGQEVNVLSGTLKQAWVDPTGNGWVRVSHGYNLSGQEIVNVFPFNMASEYQSDEETNEVLDALISLTDLFPKDYRKQVLSDLENL